MAAVCRLDERRQCTRCGKCDLCDINPEKVCDNCMECLTGGQTFRSVALLREPAPSLTPPGKARPRRRNDRP